MIRTFCEKGKYTMCRQNWEVNGTQESKGLDSYGDVDINYSENVEYFRENSQFEFLFRWFLGLHWWHVGICW